MPRQTFTPDQTWRVVQYVQSLSDPAAQEQAQVRTQEIVAQRVEKLPAGPDDAAWENLREVRIPLMPLWWNDRHISTVRVKAAHDGERLVFRLEWNDASRDVEAIRQHSFPDGAAVQLTASAEPPLFAMGAPGDPVNIWHWKALWSEDRQEFQDVATAFPNMAAGPYYGSQKGWQSKPREDAQFLSAQAVHNPIASPHRPSIVEDANAAGLGTLTSQAAEKQSVEGASSWKDGVWRLQLTRTMKASDSEDVRLRPGAQVSAAFAVWNGSAGDRNGQKNVSLWNPLRLE
jgi:complex iron-sulfur molybdoenzyme family reductase subunit gamma